MTAVDTPRPAPQRIPVGPADKLIRQVEAIDAWNCDRRARERALEAAHLTRQDRMDVTRQVGVLRRTQDAITDRAARALRGEVGPMHVPLLTGVIAHRHAWFAEKVSVLLASRGVTVLECTDNGADALGAVVAEQPDIVLASDRLAMISCDALLEQTRRFAPMALRVVQASDGRPSEACTRMAAEAVFRRQDPPAHVVDAVMALLADRAAEPARAGAGSLSSRVAPRAGLSSSAGPGRRSV